MSPLLDLSRAHPEVELREVIITRFRHKGTGARGRDIFRLLTDVWTPEGQLLASEDPALEWTLRAVQRETAEAEAASTAQIKALVAERDALREHLEKFHICGKACKAERP